MTCTGNGMNLVKETPKTNVQFSISLNGRCLRIVLTLFRFNRSMANARNLFVSLERGKSKIEKRRIPVASRLQNGIQKSIRHVSQFAWCCSNAIPFDPGKLSRKKSL